MIKHSSAARRNYERAYRLIRLYSGLPWNDQRIGDINEIEDCAILSYDYHDSHFSGWINRQRSHEWHEKYSDRYPQEYYQF